MYFFLGQEVTKTSFYVFNEIEPTRRSIDQPNNVELEFMRYLEEFESDISALKKFKTLKKLFLKFNTSLCSSAPVERMFSIAQMIHTPLRNCVKDNFFNTLLFLKLNKDL